MRIVYLAWHGSVHTRRWVGWFAERGHDVQVITCGGGDARDLDVDGNELPLRYRVHDLGEPRFGKLGYLLKIFRARKLVHDLNPEIVHAHWLTSYGLLALGALNGRKRRETPLVVTAHGDDVLIAPRNKLMRKLVQRVLRAARLITVPSEQMRAAAEELLAPAPAPAGGVAVFQYGVESTRLSAVGKRCRDERLNTPGRPLRIVSARAFLELYRIDVLLAAVALLQSRGVAVQCDLFGDGPLREQLEQQAKELNIEAVCTFHGNVSPADIERRVAASDVYVSVSESDGVSLALLEALALGAVPVLSDIPANRPWINSGKTGVLVPIEVEAVADGIQQAAELDRERVAADNLAVVAERADRDMNLAACEILIDSLVGVTWDKNSAITHNETDSSSSQKAA